MSHVVMYATLHTAHSRNGFGFTENEMKPLCFALLGEVRHWEKYASTT